MIPLNKKEVLRYLGYKRNQELTAEMSQLIDEVMMEVQEISQPRYYYQFHELAALSEEELQVVGTDLILRGKAIGKHLQKAQKVALLGATLGIGVEQQIRRYEITDLTRSLILDACCVELIEKICDLAECDIIDQVTATGLTLNRRFSPGYGDLPLATQRDFLKVIKGDTNLGITLTQTDLMIPRKSVTAIIGLFADPAEALPKRKGNFCKDCDYLECDFRIGGKR